MLSNAKTLSEVCACSEQEAQRALSICKQNMDQALTYLLERNNRESKQIESKYSSSGTNTSSGEGLSASASSSASLDREQYLYDELCQSMCREPDDALLNQFQSRSRGIYDFTRTSSDGHPFLIYAVLNSQYKIIDALFRRAQRDKQVIFDINQKNIKGNTALYYAITLKLPGNCIEMTTLLLSLGADPRPSVFSGRFAESLNCEAQSLSGEQEFSMWHDFLVSNNQFVPFSIFYWLHRSSVHQVSETERERLEILKLSALLELRYSTVGQMMAIQMLHNSVLPKQVDKENKKPLVLLFAGPSGHGKTVLASKFGSVVAKERYDKIDCTQCGTLIDLIGSATQFRGGEKGSRMTNFITQYCPALEQGGTKTSSDIAVLLLDEFEKTGEDVRNALLNAFDCGEWTDPRDQKRYNCSRVIFILTTNALDSDMKAFFQKEGIPSYLEMSNSELVHSKSKKLTSALQPRLNVTFGDPMARRIDYIVPFIPFNTMETMVIADTKLMNTAARYVLPPHEKRLLVGNVTLRYHSGVVKHLGSSKFYSQSAGVSSIISAVEKQVADPIAHRWSKGGIKQMSEIYLSWNEDLEEVFILDEEPQQWRAEAAQEDKQILAQLWGESKSPEWELEEEKQIEQEHQEGRAGETDEEGNTNSRETDGSIGSIGRDATKSIKLMEVPE